MRPMITALALCASTLVPGLAQGKPNANIDPNAYYRLTTQWQGECKGLDIVNDAHDNRPILADAANVSGQLWKLTPLGNGYYRLTTQWKGTGKSLDIVNDAHDNRPILAKTADVSGQHWKLTPTGDGYYRLTTMWQGPGKSLDIINDAHDNRPTLANTANVSGQRWRLTKETGIGTPPPHLRQGFYQKYLDADGIPILSSNKVPNGALYRVRFIVREMLSRVPAARDKLIANKVRIGILATTEVTRDLPEYHNLPEKTADGRPVDSVRGFGATMAIPLSSCAEENVLCYNTDPYLNEDIFIHEFAHTMHRLGLEPAYDGFKSELQIAFASRGNRWTNTYADTDILEYFAEGVQDWFNQNDEGNPATSAHNHVNTRAELRVHDRKLYDLLAKYFPANDNNCSCHPVQNKLHSTPSTGSSTAKAMSSAAKAATRRRVRRK